MSALPSQGIGVGLIGLGFMGRTHAACFAASGRAHIIAAFDRHPDALHAATGANNLDTGSSFAAAALAHTRRATSIDELLADARIALVSITTPTDSHVELALRALEAGKHVLVEKPVSLDPAAIRRIGACATAHGLLAMPAHCMRFWPSWVVMREALQSEQYGRPLRARFQRMGQAPSWSKDFYLDDARSGGAAIDLHIHDADYIRDVFGEPTAVHAKGSRRHIQTTYSFASGVHVEAEGAWVDDAAFEFVMAAVIECERGTLDFRLGREPELVLKREGVSTPIAVPTGTGYEGEINALLDAILAGARAAPVSMEDAAKTQELLNRELASLAQ